MPQFNDENETVYEVVTESDSARNSATEAEKAADDLNSAMIELGNEATVSVHRQVGTGKEGMEWIDSKPADAYSLEQWQHILKEKYGGGMYRFYIRVGNRIKQNKLIKIAETNEDKNKQTGMVPYTGAGNASNETILMMNQMREMQERSNNQMMMLIERMEAKENKPSVISKLLTPEAITVAAPLLTPLIAAMAKNMFKKDDPISQLTQLMALKGELDLDKNDDASVDSWPALAAKALEGLTALAPAISAGTAKQAAPSQATEQANNAKPPPMLHAFAPHLKQIAALQQQGVEPEAIAPQLIQAIPDGHRAAFGEFMERPDAVSVLLGIEPAIANDLPWWVELQGEVADRLNGGHTEENSSDGVTGNVSSTNNDGASGH